MIPKQWRYSFGLALALMLGSCSLAETDGSTSGGFAIPVLESVTQTVAIDSVQAPALTEQAVVLRGQVLRRVPVLAGWLYELQDETGDIWVVTQQSPPEIGSIVTVEGTVQYKDISNGEINQGAYYLQQTP